MKGQNEVKEGMKGQNAVKGGMSTPLSEGYEKNECSEGRNVYSSI